MNQYIDILEKAGLDPIVYENGNAQLFIYADRCWIDEIPGVFQMEPAAHQVIVLIISPDGMIGLYDEMNGDLLLDQLIDIPRPKKLLGIVEQIAQAYGEEVPVEEGIRNLRNLLK